MALTPDQLAQLSNFYKTANSGNQTINVGGNEYSTIGTAGNDEGGSWYKPNSLVRYIPGDTGKYYAVDPNTGNEQLVQWNKGGNLIGGAATDLGTMAATFAALYGAGQLAAAAAAAGGAGGAGAAAGAAPEVGGTVATGGGGALGGSGAFVGEGALSGVPAWDTAATNAGLFGGAEAAGAGATFNPAADSQLANTAINAAGGNALSGYTAAGVPSAAGATGGAGSATSGLSSWLPSGSTNGLIGAGLNAVGGMIGADASKNAANTQAQSAANALALEKQMFDKQVELQQPWHDTGVSGLNMLSQYLGLKPSDGSAGTSYGSLLKPFSMADYQADPGYAFRMQQGTQALDRSAAARGGLLSGRAAKDTLNYSQGLASQEYGNAYNRYNTDQTNQYNRLASTAGLGQTAANTIGSAAQSYGNNAANLITSSGAAQAAGQVGSANALTNGLASAWNAYQNNQLLNRLIQNYGT